MEIWKWFYARFGLLPTQLLKKYSPIISPTLFRYPMSEVYRKKTFIFWNGDNALCLTIYLTKKIIG